jgi:hypothetical protein
VELELLRENDETIAATDPAVAVAADGAALVLWQQTVQSGGYESSLWARSFSPARGWGTAQLIDDSDRVDEHRVAAGGGARFLAVWRRGSGIGASGLGWDDRWGPPRMLSDDGFRPYVAVGAGDHAFVVWQVSWPPAFGCDRFVPGTGWVGGRVLYSETDDMGVFPRVVVDERGGAIVAWHGVPFSVHGPSQITTPVWAGRFEPAFGWQEATELAPDGGPPVLGGNDRGDAIVVWIESDGSVFELWAARWEGGSGWGTPTLVVEGDAAAGAAGDVAMAPDGDALFAWADRSGAVRWKILPATAVP